MDAASRRNGDLCVGPLIYRKLSAFRGLPTPPDQTEPDEGRAQQSQARRLGNGSVWGLAPRYGEQTGIAGARTGGVSVDGVDDEVRGTVTTRWVGEIEELIDVS